ncbi:MAG TPA: hypothetical protein VLA52_08925, partial [Thermohalobaculum sp.]|nr:hypothetical protein [Thermohalobaculum sp.]
MTISVTVNGDFTLDETVDLQNSSLPAEAPAEDKNDEDVLYASLHQDLKDLVAAMGLTDSFPDSAPATVGSRAAKSQTNLITVTSDGNLTDISLTGAYDDKGNADPSDDTVTPLNVYDPVAENFGDGGATGLTTTDGNAILLYSDVDNSGTGFAEAAGLTGNVVFGIEDTTGDIVFIIFMEETDLGVVAGLDTTQLQFSMLTFEAIQHDTAGTTVAAHDDSVNLGDFLSLSVGETTKFDFSNAPAGKSLFLMAQDSNNGTAVVVTSDALEVQINTSKAQETTIGWGSQGINAGETVVLTFVSGGLDSNFVIPNLDQNEADVAGNIVFDNPVPVDSGSFEIAQKVGSATAAIRLRAYDGSTVTDGAAFFNDTGGTEVDFASITVNNPDGTLRLAWTGGPDVTGNGLTINILTLAEAAATPDPDDQEGDIVITGLNEGDVILYEADGTMSRLWVTGVSGNVDIGAISVNEAGGGIAPIGDAFTIEDAGPTAAISLTGTTVVHDESAGVQNGGPNIPGVEDNNDDDQAGAVPGAIALFETDESLAARLGWAQSSGAVVDTSATDFGADGERDADGEGGDPPDGIDLELVLSAEGADSGLNVLSGMGISLYTQTVTVASEDITVVVGRVNSEDTTEPVDPRGDPDPTGDVAFVLYLDEDGLLSTAQYRELQNPDG